MKIFLLYTIAFVFLHSCINDKKKALANEIISLNNKTIYFPKQSFFISAKDTIDINFDDYDYKIVSYTNTSKGCLDCTMKLKQWKNFINKISSITDGNVVVIKYVTPKRPGEVYSLLLREQYYSPVCIDMNADFYTTNKLPDDERLQCFLLDKHNNIMLVGDPLLSESVTDLYVRTICERLGIERPKESAEFQKTVNSLGEFSWKTNRSTSFEIRNDKEVMMYIDSLYTSCECTTATIDRREIAPHKKAVVNVTFKADRPEQFMREIYADVRGGEQIVMVIEGNATE